MFGFVQLAALSAIKGMAAADITEAHVQAINAAFAEQGYHVAVINQAQFAQANEVQGQLNAANGQITTLTRERDNALAEAARFGSQAGHVGTKVPKAEESTAGKSADVDIADTDAELKRLRVGMQMN